MQGLVVKGGKSSRDKALGDRVCAPPATNGTACKVDPLTLNLAQFWASGISGRRRFQLPNGNNHSTYACDMSNSPKAKYLMLRKSDRDRDRDTDAKMIARLKQCLEVPAFWFYNLSTHSRLLILE